MQRAAGYSRGFSAGDGVRAGEHSAVSRQRGGLPGCVGVDEVVDNRLSQGATSKIRCVDVAGLIAAAVLRNHPQARVLPFECDVVDVQLDARQSVMHNAQKLAAVGGGSTNCSAPLRRLLNERARVDLVIMVSDNESWVDKSRHGSTATMECWIELKSATRRRARCVSICCLTVPPGGGTKRYFERRRLQRRGVYGDR